MGAPPFPVLRCGRCRHFRGILGFPVAPGLEDDARVVCAAFPEGIPGEIVDGRFDHAGPHPRDDGIRFEPIPEDSRSDQAGA